MRSCPRCRTLYSSQAQFCGLDGERLVETAKDPLIGARISGYLVRERIGAGGMACVYRALQESTGAEVAIKLLFGEMASDREFAERLKREALAAMKIEHPNVVRVLELSATDEGMTFMVMELLRGRTLDRVILQDAPLGNTRIARFAKQMALGLAAAHELGFVHRDLKPSNVMVLSEGGVERVKLLDFGLVQQWETEAEALMSKLTRTGVTVGTPYYMAPERMRGEPATPQADLYALGAVIYEMSCGVPPYRGPLAEVIAKQLTEKPAPLPLPSPLEPLALQLLARDADRRPRSARDVIAAIDRLGLEPAEAADQQRTSRATIDLDLDSGASVRSLPLIDPADVVEAKAPPTRAILLAARIGWWNPRRWLLVAVLGGLAGLWWLAKLPASSPLKPTSEPLVMAMDAIDRAAAQLDPPQLAPPRDVEQETGEHTTSSSLSALLEAALEETEEITSGSVAADAAGAAAEEEEADAPPPTEPSERAAVSVTKAPRAISRAVAPRTAPARPKKLSSIIMLTTDLDAALRSRGLSMADLSSISRTSRLVKRWEKARFARDVEEANAAGQALITEVKQLSIDDRLVLRKLNRVYRTLRASKSVIPLRRRTAMEDQYKTLRAYFGKKGGLTTEQRRMVLFGAARLEREVASATRAGG